jgi:hypothetical protein
MVREKELCTKPGFFDSGRWWLRTEKTVGLYLWETSPRAVADR